MNTNQRQDRKPAIKYRFDKAFDVVEVRGYNAVDGQAPVSRKSSPARAEFKSARLQRRELARTASARAMAAVHEAATR